MEERKLVFEVNVYDDEGNPESFNQRTNALIQGFGKLCAEYGLYYGGYSSLREISKEEWK